MKDEKIIAKKKRANHNIYAIPDGMFVWLALSLAAVAAIAAVMLVISLYYGFYSVYYTDYVDISLLNGFSLTLAAVIVVPVTAASVLKPRKKKIIPYRWDKNCRFTGFRMITGDDISASDGADTGILPRDREAGLLNQLLSEQFSRDGSGQIVCLTGESGCGKTTILTFFKELYGGIYEIFDFSDAYEDLPGKMRESFGENLSQNQTAGTGKRRVVLIFDQFEMYFLLNESKRQEIRSLIRQMNLQNTGMIVAVRQEYLGNFLNEYDVDRAPSALRQGILAGYRGKALQSRMKPYSPRRKRKTEFTKWENETIRAVPRIHLEKTQETEGKASLTQRGILLLSCTGPDFAKADAAGDEVSLRCRWEAIFGSDGRNYYERNVQHGPLIRRQIFANMAECAKKDRWREKDLEELFRMNDTELLKRWYDVQLCSTGNYFTAARILYLLCMVYRKGMSMLLCDLEDALLPDQFSKREAGEVSRVLEQLQKLQLVRIKTKGTENAGAKDPEYEAGHAFLAETFPACGISGLDGDVTSVLDQYARVYMNRGEGETGEERDEAGKKHPGTRYVGVLYAAAAVLAVWLGISMQSFMITYYNTEPLYLLVLMIMEFTMLYIFLMHQKVFRFSRRERDRNGGRILLQFLYAGILVLSLIGIMGAGNFAPEVFFVLWAGEGGIGLLEASGSDIRTVRSMRKRAGFMVRSGVFCVILHLLYLTTYSWLIHGFVYGEMAASVIWRAYLDLTRENLYAKRKAMEGEV